MNKARHAREGILGRRGDYASINRNRRRRIPFTTTDSKDNRARGSLHVLKFLHVLKTYRLGCSTRKSPIAR